MTAIDLLLDSVLADELAGARASSGAIGYVGCDVPLDLLLASERFACHLPWSTGRSTPFADQWLESSFAPWARSMLEDWSAGRFDFFDCVVFSRGDDNSQRLYYYICELQRRGLIGGPSALVFDIAKIRRESSIDRSISAVRHLALQLEIDPDRLHAGIERANRRRVLFEKLDAGRGRPGARYERIARASLFADLDEILDETTVSGDTAEKRVLLAGSAPPDERLHVAIEESDWVVTGELHERPLTRFGPEIDASFDDAARAIGRHAHDLTLGARSFADRGALLVDAARRTEAGAVLLWLIEEDEALTWTVPRQRAALRAAGIPVYVATRRKWEANDGITEELAGFLGGLSS